MAAVAGSCFTKGGEKTMKPELVIGGMMFLVAGFWTVFYLLTRK